MLSTVRPDDRRATPSVGTIVAVAAGEAQLARRLQPFTTTIFATMSELAAATGSVNLGQGFPDTDGPDELREVAVAAIRDGRNQYPPSAGIAGAAPGRGGAPAGLVRPGARIPRPRCS